MQNEREINRERRHPNTAHYYPSVLTIMKIVTQKRTRAHARIHRGYFRYSCDIPLPPSSKRRELKTFERTTGTNKTVRGGNRGLQSVHVREKKLHNLFFDSHTYTKKNRNKSFHPADAQTDEHRLYAQTTSPNSQVIVLDTNPTFRRIPYLPSPQYYKANQSSAWIARRRLLNLFHPIRRCICVP